MSVPGNMCKAPGEFPERRLQRNGGCSFLSYRENKMNTSDRFIYKANNISNWFRLDSDGAHKVHKCTSNIRLYC